MKPLIITEGSRASKEARTIAEAILSQNQIELLATGVMAVNEAVKSLAKARDLLKQKDIDLVFIVEFSGSRMNNLGQPSIKFFVKQRSSLQ